VDLQRAPEAGAGGGAIGGIGRDQRHHRPAPAGEGGGGELGGAAGLLGAVGAREAEIAVGSGAQVVAVEDLHLFAGGGERLREGPGQRAFARPGQAGQPQDQRCAESSGG
jgi:hypothetical protein